MLCLKWPWLSVLGPSVNLILGFRAQAVLLSTTALSCFPFHVSFSAPFLLICLYIMKKKYIFSCVLLLEYIGRRFRSQRCGGLFGWSWGAGCVPSLLSTHKACQPIPTPVHVTIPHTASPILTPLPFLYASEEPAGALKSPATDRTLLSPRDPRGDGTLGFLLEGNFLTCMKGTEPQPGL